MYRRGNISPQDRGRGGHRFSQGRRTGDARVHENLENAQHVEFSCSMRRATKCSGRVPPLWATEMARSGQVPYHSWIDKLLPQRFFFERTRTQSGENYLLLMELPPGPRVFFGPHGIPGLGLIIAILSSNLFCFFLSRYLTSPIVRLREATKLAGGEFVLREPERYPKADTTSFATGARLRHHRRAPGEPG